MLGAVVGSASTALVHAAIPGTNGTINGCYNRLTGVLKVKDVETGQTCNGLENDISWPSQGTASQAVSYIHFNDDGTLDTTHSRGVISVQIVPRPNTESAFNACIKLSSMPMYAEKPTGWGGSLARGNPTQTPDERGVWV
ncbi:hypothetical protein TM7_0473 [candidate division TM7 genomosp. GTL1]|nr:hypothetical protein TM7_0473 [candidate division TM7 genomosp. GTL1]